MSGSRCFKTRYCAHGFSPRPTMLDYRTLFAYSGTLLIWTASLNTDWLTIKIMLDSLSWSNLSLWFRITSVFISIDLNIWRLNHRCSDALLFIAESTMFISMMSMMIEEPSPRSESWKMRSWDEESTDDDVLAFRGLSALWPSWSRDENPQACRSKEQYLKT